MTVPPITIDNTPTEVMIEDNEGVFCEAKDKGFIGIWLLISSEGDAQEVW